MFLAPKARLHQHSHQRAGHSGGRSSGEEMSATNAPVDHNVDASARRELAEAKHALPQTTWFLRICKFFGIVTGLAAILGIVANLAALGVPSSAANVALRLYGIALCSLSLLTECDWTRLFSWLAILETWIGRGLNNAFCGVLLLVFVDDTVRLGDELVETPENIRLLRKFAGNALIVVGLVYALGGVLCLNKVKERHLNKIRRRDQALVQKQELEHKKQEIEMLLKDTESQLEKI